MKFLVRGILQRVLQIIKKKDPERVFFVKVPSISHLLLVRNTVLAIPKV